MVLQVARTHLGSMFHSRNILSRGICTCRVPPISTYSSGFVQRNASTTTRRKQSPTTPKATQKAGNSLHAPASKTPLVTEVPQQQQQRTSPSTPPTRSQKPLSKNATAKVAATKKHLEMTDEEREKELQRFLQMSEVMPTVDLFAQDQTTLDVMIPHQYDKSLPISKRFQRMFSNITNYFKNAAALKLLLTSNSIPGIIIFHRQSLMTRLSNNLKSFGTTSVKPDGLLGPFRRFALDIYEELNTAVAHRNERDARKVTTSEYQKHICDLIKKSLKTNPNGRLIWQLHRVVEPIKVVSLRVTQGYFDEQEPKFGNRWMAHALVKFHTEQSLEIYDRHARPLHTPAKEEKKTYIVVDADKKVDKWRVPAQKRRVKEYLVLEKRMWQKGPWVVREQMWPTVEDSPKL